MGRGEMVPPLSFILLARGGRGGARREMEKDLVDLSTFFLAYKYSK